MRRANLSELLYNRSRSNFWENALKIFGRSTQKSRAEHFCDHCFNYIMPGDIYERYVWMPTPDKAIVLKRHSWPDCPPNMYEPAYEEPVEYAVSYAMAIQFKSVMRVLVDGSIETRSEPELVFVPRTEPEPPDDPGYDDDIPF